MSESTTFGICILVSLIGLAIVVGIVLFGVHIFGLHRRKYPFDHPWFDHIFHLWEKNGGRANLPRYISDSYAEYLQRRNEFWTSYGQVLIAVFILIVITILLLTKSISAEAGLPILSGISGFVIAKGVSIGKTSSPPERDNQ